MAALDPKTLSLADLEAFDPRAPANGRERRFCCPLPGPCEGKRVDRTHRSLAVNTETGAWHCHRCGASGLLREFWTEREPVSRKERARARAVQVFRGELRSVEPTPDDSARRPSEEQQGCFVRTFPGSPALRYLEARGIPPGVAVEHGCGYAPDWHGVPRVTFPVRDAAGALTAISGRAIRPCHDADKHRVQGPKGQGVFHPAALAGHKVIVTEAPIKAMALAACGYPAIGLIGIAAPPWLPRAVALKDVWVATDADTVGDDAAEELRDFLSLTHPGRKHRLRPPEPFKDWDEALVDMGSPRLGAWLLEQVGAVQAVSPGAASLGVTRAHSRVLGEEILLVENAACLPPGEPVVYTRAEVEMLRGLPVDVLRTVHALKKEWGGVYIGPSPSPSPRSSAPPDTPPSR